MNESAIFNAAVKLPPGQRDEFLAAACAGNVVLRKEVEGLLREHDDEASGFMAAPAVVLATDAFPPIAEGAGTVIGHYKLLQKIGEGGFGVVYMAEQQEPVRRKVAFKIIKPGMDTREVIARFESERQALALMDHPNIARVLDAGATESGRPYFVMELVKGVPITEYCDKNNLPADKRLELFITICHAVQHAHQKGVIHRDLKPTNVMVTLHDGTPVPKVIDFGVAKATTQRLTERTLFTAYGQMVGTPAYMSPEQAEMSGLDIDTRSDIYSLGVLLYELLTGTTPFDSKRLRDAGYVEMQRIIREEEPPRPSTRVSTLGAALTVVSSHRSTDPSKLRQLLRGDLDLIVMKAMEKERSRRYETPNSFAEDIQRYLKHEAILARPQSAAYRMQKWIQRNRAAAITTAAIALLLVLGTVISTWLAIRASRASRDALMAKNEAETNLREVKKQREVAVAAQGEAERAQRQEAEQRHLAEQREAEAKAARTAETAEREAAERERDKATTLNDQLHSLTEEQRRTIYAAEMNLVRLESQRNNFARMQDLLLRQIPGPDQQDLRGFEWNYWYRYLHRATVVLRAVDLGISGEIEPFTILPGGELIACKRDTRTTRSTEIRDLSSGKVIGTIPAALVAGLNFTPLTRSGGLVQGSASSFNFPGPLSIAPFGGAEFHVWEVSGGKAEKRSFVYPQDTIRHVSFLAISEDGRYVGALGIDPSHTRENPCCHLLVWQVDSGELVLDKQEPRELSRLALSRDGSRLAAYVTHGTSQFSNDKRDVAVVYDIASKERIGVLRHDDDIDNAFFLPDRSRVLFTSLGWSGRCRKELLSWKIGEDAAQQLGNEYMPDYVKGAVSPDGKLFAFGGHSVAAIRIVDTTTGMTLSTMHDEASNVNSLTFSVDGKRIVACTMTGVVLSWDVTQDEDLFDLRNRPSRLLTRSASFPGYALSPDQSLLAVQSEDGAILIRRRDGSESILRPNLAPGVGAIARVEFSRDNRRLLFATANSLQVFEVESGKLLWTGSNPPAPRVAVPKPFGMSRFLNSPVFSRDARQVVLVRGARTHVFDATTGKETKYELSNEAAAVETRLVEHQATGELLVPVVIVRGPDLRLLRLHDATSSKIIAEASLHTNLQATDALVAPDARHVALADRKSSHVEVWDLHEQREHPVVSCAGSYVVFDARGERAAVLQTEAESDNRSTGSTERIAQATLWDIGTGRQLAAIALRGSSADEVRFSPDGRRLLTLHGKIPSGFGGKVPEGRLWDVGSGRELMGIPVAEVNHYTWDMLFDETGNRLTLYFITKTLANGGGGRGAFVFDGPPLSETEETTLVARRRVDALFRQHLLKGSVIAAINTDGTLAPRLRQAMIRLSEERSDNPDALAAQLTGLLRVGPDGNEIAEGLRWADALIELEPKNPAHYESRAELWWHNADYDRVIRDCDEAIRIDAKRAVAFVFRGAAWAEKNELDKALRDLDEGVRLDANLSAAYYRRALLWEKKQDIDRAIADYTEVIRLVVTAPALYYSRGNAWKKKGRYAEALKDWREAIARSPAYYWPNNAIAWQMATCPDDAFRDGKGAVEYATKACESSSWRNGSYVDTLGAAYAEAGNFDEATKYAAKAMELAASDTERSNFAARLALYREGKPYREPAVRPAAGAPAAK